MTEPDRTPIRVGQLWRRRRAPRREAKIAKVGAREGKSWVWWEFTDTGQREQAWAGWFASKYDLERDLKPLNEI